MNPYYPFTVNVDALASALMSMVEDHPDGACIAYGMFPAAIMQAFDSALKDKIPDEYYLPSEDTLEGRFRGDGASIRKNITTAVSAAMLRMSPCFA